MALACPQIAYNGLKSLGRSSVERSDHIVTLALLVHWFRLIRIGHCLMVVWFRLIRTEPCFLNHWF